jgi:hypothetical protein
MLELLKRWWEDKYHLPSNHELFQTSTYFDLLIGFWEDQFYKNPLEVYRTKEGEVQFVKTGDEFIDKWEQELAEGKIPNYLEAFTPEQVEKIKRLRSRGTDSFGKPVGPSPTLRDVAETVTQDAINQGLGRPSLPYQRFSNKDIPE